MFYFVWDSSFDIGIDVIDRQHRHIVDYINRLHEAIATNNQAVIHEVFDLVVNYTLTHFTFEEKLMEQAGYPHTDAHREVHKAFTQRIQDYRVRLLRGEDVAKRLLSDLRIWLTSHIKTEDRDYAEHVRMNLADPGQQGWLSRTLGRFFNR